MKTTSSIKTSLLLMVIIFIFNSCSKAEDAISYELAGSWKVIYFMDSNKKIIKTEANTWFDINNGDITANFNEPDSNGKGTISGIKVSNGYIGDYIIQGNGEISIGTIRTTFINEPEWTELFHISSAENFEIKNSRLLVYYNNKKNIIAFERN